MSDCEFEVGTLFTYKNTDDYIFIVTAMKKGWRTYTLLFPIIVTPGNFYDHIDVVKIHFTPILKN